MGRKGRKMLGARLALVVLLALWSVACPGSNPTQPTPPANAPTVTSVSPASGPSSGGTTLTIAGSNFSGTPVVLVGGVPATDVRTSGTVVLTAVTGARAAGLVDVTVTAPGGSATLPSAFTYVAVPAPTVAAVSPATGSTAGGTVVTITGTNFGPGATVSFGGVPGTAVEVLGATSLRATTGPRSAGVVDVAVTVGGQTGTLARGFTYQSGDNTPPRITGLTVQGTRANEPANFADIGEEVVVTATVVDAETPVGQLLYAWTADGGTFTGTGATVRWRAPTGITTPAQLRLTLTVSEPALDGSLSPLFVVSTTTTVRVHDSTKEVSELSVRFLEEFSAQEKTPTEIVRDFWNGCAGKAAELEDVKNHQQYYDVTSWAISNPTSVSFAFNSRCPKDEPGDACIAVPCLWNDIRLTDNQPGTTTGTDLLSAVYRESRWWLCSSRWDGTSTRTLVPGVPPSIR